MGTFKIRRIRAKNQDLLAIYLNICTVYKAEVLVLVARIRIIAPAVRKNHHATGRFNGRKDHRVVVLRIVGITRGIRRIRVDTRNRGPG
jgi:hypothetical protein